MRLLRRLGVGLALVAAGACGVKAPPKPPKPPQAAPAKPSQAPTPPAGTERAEGSGRAPFAPRTDASAGDRSRP